MLDFTSVPYLGFRHDSRSVRPWSQLTTGVPSALAEPAIALEVARRLARLQGCEQAVVGSSTLHLFWDLFGQLAQRPFAIFLDASAYPIAQWGVARAAMHGRPVYRFPHRDVAALAKMVRQISGKQRPLIVSDGLCSSCGCAAPVANYRQIAQAHKGLLLLDDTQALGLLGHSADAAAPYGRLGGGTLAHQALFGPKLMLISSLAKSFGVPLAVLSGSREVVQAFQAHSETRVHCSPPSLAVLHAAERALALNETQGEARRQKLAQNVRLWRYWLAEAGITSDGGLFPMQTIRIPPGLAGKQLYQRLASSGVRSVWRQGCNGRCAITFVITARHRPNEIKQAAARLISAIHSNQFQHQPRRHQFLLT